MHPFLLDALDLARFRVRPLSHYGYAWWLPLAWLTLLSVLQALFGSELKASLPVRLVFVVGFAWVQALLLALFFGWWLKLGKRWSGEGSLFPLVVLCSSAQLFEPAIGLLSEAMQLPVIVLLAFYQLAVWVVACSRATGVTVGYVIGGLFAYLPTALILALLSLSIASSAGWLPDPPSQQPGFGQPPAPLAGSN
ncbi:hypothetical protein [Chitinimonas koreensis]|uniref:hypothetical protein n=1 Tax=Chitinimonas koreensis TaxID=356302 RepID=UPI0003FB98FD|nr:hypothetical protein [Chitinimonas koreensis]QNM97695.1 hypothetical protein H9L41_05200 [Chitinimonas koreensis]